MITETQIDNWFTYHAPKAGQPERYQAIRDAAKNLAKVILRSTQSSADQTTAIRKVREAVMTANAAIACEVPVQTSGEPPASEPAAHLV